MKRKKFLNTLILCFLIGNNLSEGKKADRLKFHLFQRDLSWYHVQDGPCGFRYF